MAGTDKPEFLPEIWQQPITNGPLVRHHETLALRYKTGEDVVASTMMAAAHYAAAVAHGEIRFKEQACRLVASLTAQQTKMAAMLATLFVARGRAW